MYTPVHLCIYAYIRTSSTLPPLYPLYPLYPPSLYTLQVTINQTRSVEELEVLLVRAEKAIDAQTSHIMAISIQLAAAQVLYCWWCCCYIVINIVVFVLYIILLYCYEFTHIMAISMQL
jgi:fatty acid desaturase